MKSKPFRGEPFPRQHLTQLQFEPEDHARAETLARHLGYTQFTYTSTSALWGLFCLRDRASDHAGCIIKTLELGLMFVQDVEDVNLEQTELVEMTARRRARVQP